MNHFMPESSVKGCHCQPFGIVIASEARQSLFPREKLCEAIPQRSVEITAHLSGARNDTLPNRNRPATVAYWDGNARWHKLWVEHNVYHNRIIQFLMAFVRPGWKVLDIGAGNGVLSLPLCAIGCEVTALEPSAGMRDLFYEESHRRGINTISVDTRAWEDFPDEHMQDYDLIIACNSLHLTRIGFSDALEKVIRRRSKKCIHSFRDLSH